MEATERTLALIKPDAVKAGKASEIKQLVEVHGFAIVAQHKMQLTKARAEEFYSEHLGKPFFPRLVEFMTSGPIWAMVLSKKDAIKSWRTLMGPTNTLTAREQAPKSLRALYGTDGTFNATHGSDSPTSAAREIKFFFPNLIMEPLLDSAAAKVYISQHLQPTLSKALTALAREKPSAERFEAITFLAEYLLNNNPNKPRVVLPDAWDPSVEQEDDEEEFANAQLARLAAASKAAAPPPESDTSPVSDQPEAPLAPEQTPTPTSRPASAAAQGPGATPAAAEPPPEPQAPAASEELDVDEQNQAATKVQATFRGYQARKQLADERRQGGGEEPAPPEVTEEPVPPEVGGEPVPPEVGEEPVPPEVGEEPVPPTEPAAAPAEEQPGAEVTQYTSEQQEAVVRIQAAGRGMLDRKRVAALKTTAGPVDAPPAPAEETTPPPADDVTPEGSGQEYATPEASAATEPSASATDEVTPENSDQ